MGTGLGRVAVAGGGPAGLFLARMLGLTQPGTVVDVYERNPPDQASGFGVALSERTVNGIAAADPHTHRRIVAAGTALSGIEVRLPGDTRRYDGFGLFTISRHTLLTILREGAEAVGARLHFRHEARAEDLDAGVVAFADGAGSGHRNARRDAFGTRVYAGAARYIWLGTSAAFDAATFAFVQTEYGPMAAHAYQYALGASTVVVETDEATWRNAGLDVPASPPYPAGEIDGDALNLLSEIFASHLAGHRLASNRSRWDRFSVVHNERWSIGNLVLLGDAAHTAHFTVGSGTKMAFEDAIALATALRDHTGPVAAFAAYERQRRVPVTRTQRLAEPSMRWWESYGRRLHLPPAQFGMHFLTRTGAFSYLGLRRRCGDRVDEAEAAYHRAAGTDPAGTDLAGPDPDGTDLAGPPGNAAAAPLRLGPVRLPNRLVTVCPPAPGAGPAPAGSGLVLVRGDTAVPPPSAGETAFGVLRPASGRPARTRTRVRVVEFVELPCPAEPEWTQAADELVRSAARERARGAAGVLLRADFAAPSWWDTTLRHASRIRTEAATAVAVCVPADWALDLARYPDVDPWPARIHVALVSGRIDLVVAWPLTRSQLGRAAGPAAAP